jgi:hypothetical protein
MPKLRYKNHLLNYAIDQNHKGNRSYAGHVDLGTRVIFGQSDVRYLDVNRLVDAHDKEPAQVHYEINLTVATALFCHLNFNFLA